ncbi:MAG: ABC transporter ATP-binding protein [bacterium]|nr:ABC transporter ATP-binding protein [bacterium]
MADTRTAKPLVTVRDLNVHFKGSRKVGDAVRAVDGVDLDIFPGETLCIVGESGSGKTTLVRAIGHLAPITSGSVRFGDVDVAQLPRGELRSMRRRVQYVFQDPFESFDRRQSIFSIVAQPLRVHKLVTSSAELESRVHEALEECGLEPAREFARLYPHQLSGGQRQRVSIAAAIVLRPELLVADEPVSMLDVSVRSDILSLFVSLKESHRMTLLFVTHDLSVAWEIADRIAVMYLGKVVEEGSADQVIGRPANPYTHALVTAIPVPDPHDVPPELGVKGDIGDIVGLPAGCRFHPRCPYAEEPCSGLIPPLTEVADGHRSACIRNDELELQPPHRLATGSAG